MAFPKILDTPIESQVYNRTLQSLFTLIFDPSLLGWENVLEYQRVAHFLLEKSENFKVLDLISGVGRFVPELLLTFRPIALPLIYHLTAPKYIEAPNACQMMCE